MEGHAFSMGLSSPEHRLEGSNSNSTGISSSRGDHGDGAEGTARALKKRKARSENWSGEQTQQLLDACSKFEEHASTSKGRRRMCAPPKWEIISGSVHGKTANECRRRSETLTKSFNKIKSYRADHHKQFSQLGDDDFRCLKLATMMEANWYYRICKIKVQPENAMGASSPDSGDQIISSSPALVAVMAQTGPHVDIVQEVVGTPEPAWRARDPPRSMSPTDLQSHSDREPGLPPLADSPCHSHQHVNRDKPWTATAVHAAEPLHLPPVDLHDDIAATVDAAYVPSQSDAWRPRGFDDQSPHYPSHQVVRDTGHNSDALMKDHFDYTFPDVEGPSDFEQFLSAETDDDDDEEEDVGLVRLWEDSFYAQQ